METQANTTLDRVQVRDYIIGYVGNAVTADRMADDIVELQERMKSDIVHFNYDKKDGSSRNAFGTRDGSVIRRYHGDPSGDPSRRRKGFDGTFPYFDLERRAWRCFRLENFNCMDDAYAV